MRLRDYAKDERARVAAINGFLGFAFNVLIAEHGLTMIQISTSTGLCMATLRRLKKGETVTSNIKVGTLQKIEKAAGIAIGWPTEKTTFKPFVRNRKKPSKAQRTLIG